MTVPSDDSYDPSCHLSYRDLAVDHQDKPNTIKVRIKASTPFVRVWTSSWVGQEQICVRSVELPLC